jgi:tripartite-type tricarboxylate transporter receptor subunit TctC
LQVVAVTSPERLGPVPDIPTLTEQGVAFVRFGWLGFCAGSGTAPAVVTLLNKQVGAIVNSADYRAMIEKAGSIPISSTPEELARILTETYEQTVAVAREFGLQAD